MTKDVRETQRMVLAGDLYQAVIETEQSLRHKSEYDVRTAEERQMAILCWALQESANGTAGTCLTLAGVYRTLNGLRPSAPREET